MIPKLARANEFTLTRTGLVPAHAEKFTIVVIDADKGKTRQRGPTKGTPTLVAQWPEFARWYQSMQMP